MIRMLNAALWMLFGGAILLGMVMDGGDARKLLIAVLVAWVVLLILRLASDVLDRTQ